MNADDRGMNLAEKRGFKCPCGGDSQRHAPDCDFPPPHGGYPGVPVVVSSVPDPGLPRVDWESAAGRAFQEAHAYRQEIARLRRHMPADALREYDRLCHARSRPAPPSS